jgi:hypothetical protein
MDVPVLLAALAAAAVLLLILALKLRGPSDLTGPPKRKRRRFSAAEAGALAELVERGEAEEAVRRIRAAGHDEATARRLVGLIERLGPAGTDRG